MNQQNKPRLSGQGYHGLLLAILLMLAGPLLLRQQLQAQNMWIWNQRTHPELQWETLETPHFNIHFHQGLEAIAQRSAGIAEAAYQPILDQLNLHDFGRTDIILSAEDEIMNGFATPSNQIFIWVSQNDVAGHFGGSDKWLKLVITHEFQHVAQFQAHRTWAGIFGGASIPLWWFEGMAEYMTEVWRVGRSDARLKIHTWQDRLDQLDPHDDGYAKVLYLAWKYGDSTLVKISQHRIFLDPISKRWPIWYHFPSAFKDATGETLEAFEEDWRRTMNTYYYALRAQKEAVDDVGQPYAVKGFDRVLTMAIAPDSSGAVIIGRRSASMRDQGVYLYTFEPEAGGPEIKEIHYGRFSGQPAWSPDNRHIVLSEYHRGKHGSLVYDLRLIDTETGQARWVTRDLRAHHPVFSRAADELFFVAHPGVTSQIYRLDLSSGMHNAISSFEGDTQVRDLALSNQGERLAFAIQDESGDVDIATMHIDGSAFGKFTQDPQEDLFPIWTRDDSGLVFTSYRNETPNLFRVNLADSSMTQMTDVAEGIFSRQRLPHTDQILAATLADVDTVRLRVVSAERAISPIALNIRSPFKAWRRSSPVPNIRTLPDTGFQGGTRHSYKSFDSFRSIYNVIWPSAGGILLMTGRTDALGKHLVNGGLFLAGNAAESGGYLNYINLKHHPLLTFTATRNLVVDYLRNFKDGFIEYRNGIGIGLTLPLNSGNTLSSNHTLKTRLRMGRRVLLQFNERLDPESDQTLRTPDTDEMSWSLSYAWKSQRPSKTLYSLPRHGHGVLFHYQKTLPQIWGENDHTQYWAEGFLNSPMFKSPFVFYGRLKYAGQSGRVLEQDRLGFSEAAPFYFSTEYLALLRSLGIFNAPETYSLRGQLGDYAASHLILSIAELRAPLVDAIPLNVFGLGLQNFTAAIFTDMGYLPATGEVLRTQGIEIRYDVSFQGLSLVTLGSGLAVDVSENQAVQTYSPYMRMALVNPF